MDKEISTSLEVVISSCSSDQSLEDLEKVFTWLGSDKDNLYEAIFELRKRSFDDYRHLDAKVNVFLESFKRSLRDYSSPDSIDKSSNKVTLYWFRGDRKLSVEISLSGIFQDSPYLPKELYHERDFRKVWSWLNSWEV